MSKVSPLARPKVLIAMGAVAGGTLTHIEYFLSCTDSTEFDVHLAVSGLRDASARSRFEEWRAAGWKVHDVPMLRRAAPVRDALAFRRLVGLCLRERFDIVHTHCAKAGFLGRLAARLAGAMTVHTPHVFPFGRGGCPSAERVYLALERRAARWTDRLVLLSRYQLNLVLRHGLLPADRTVTIPNGVDSRRFSGLDGPAARANMGLGSHEPVALAVGRLCGQKGMDVLIDALALTARIGAAPLVLIVGSGPLERALRAQAERLAFGDRVRMLGATTAIEPCYAACDLVVMPSRFEGMPYVILEAKAAGRPAAVSSVSGMEEFVRHGEDGFLVPPDNTEAWARVLSLLSTDRRAFLAAGERAKAGLRPEWHARRSVERLHAVYRELAEEKRERSLKGCAGV